MEITQKELAIRNDQLARLRGVLSGLSLENDPGSPGGLSFQMDSVLKRVNNLLPSGLDRVEKPSQIPAVVAQLVDDADEAKRRLSVANSKLGDVEQFGLGLPAGGGDIEKIQAEREQLQVELEKARRQIKSLSGTASAFFIGDTPTPRGKFRRTGGRTEFDDNGGVGGVNVGMKNGSLKDGSKDVSFEGSPGADSAAVMSELIELREQLAVKDHEIEMLRCASVSETITKQLRRNMDTISELQGELNRMAGRSVKGEEELFHLRAVKRVETEKWDLLNSELAGVRGELTAAVAELNRGKWELQQERMKGEKIELEKKELLKSIDGLNKQVAQVKLVVELKEEELSRMRSRVEDADGAKEGLTGQIAQMEIAHRERVGSLEKQLARETEVFRMAVEERELLKKQVLDTNGQIQRMQGELKQFDSIREAAVLELKKSLVEKDNRASELSEAMLQKDARVTELTTQLGSLQAELSRTTEDHRRGEAQLKQIEIALDLLEQQKSRELDQRSSEIRTLQFEVDRLKRDLLDSKLVEDEMGKNRAKATTDLETKLANCIKSEAVCKAELVECRNKVAEGEKELSLLGAQKRGMESHVEQLEKEVADTKAELKRNFEEKQLLVRKLESANGMIEKCMQRSTLASNAETDLQNTLNEKIQLVNNLQAKIASLEEDLAIAKFDSAVEFMEDQLVRKKFANRETQTETTEKSLSVNTYSPVGIKLGVLPEVRESPEGRKYKSRAAELELQVDQLTRAILELQDKISMLEEKLAGTCIPDENPARRGGVSSNLAELQRDALQDKISLLENEIATQSGNTASLRQAVDSGKQKRFLVEAASKELADKSYCLWQQYLVLKKKVGMAA